MQHKARLCDIHRIAFETTRFFGQLEQRFHCSIHTCIYRTHDNHWVGQIFSGITLYSNSSRCNIDVAQLTRNQMPFCILILPLCIYHASTHIAICATALINAVFRVQRTTCNTSRLKLIKETMLIIFFEMSIDRRIVILHLKRRIGNTGNRPCLIRATRSRALPEAKILVIRIFFLINIQRNKFIIEYRHRARLICRTVYTRRPSLVTNVNANNRLIFTNFANKFNCKGTFSRL